MSKSFHVPPGTKIGVIDCPACGSKVAQKVNRSQTIYANCYNSDESGDRCGHQVRYGAKQSAELRRQYLESTGEIEPVKKPKAAPPAPADDDWEAWT